jgi:SRSO17 transposase
MQRFVSDAPWDDEHIMQKYRNMVSDDLGQPDGAIIFDESGFVKKGEDSVGVGRQYCGAIGKVDNCQVGVFAAYTSAYGYALIDKRLYIPEQWFSDDYRLRREKCKLPADIKFKTKPQLAAEMLGGIAEQKQLPFRYVLADSVYAASPEFIAAVDALAGVAYLVQMPEDTLCRLKHPGTVVKTYKYRGRERTKKILASSREPISIKMLAAGINNFFWYRRKISEGAKGPIEYEFTKKRIVLAHGGLPQKTVWLLIRRTMDKEPRYGFFIANARQAPGWKHSFG